MTRACRPRRRSSRPSSVFANFIASTPKRFAYLPQPWCGSGLDLEHHLADGEARSDREVGVADVEIDVELVAGLRPALRVVGRRAISSR